MSPQRPRERLLGLLRRTAKPQRPGDERSTADDSALWSAHERALVRVRDAGAAAQRIASTAARQRAAIDAVADRARALASRAAEVQNGFSQVIDAFDRLALVALNAGLEGARLGEAEGRQLGLVSDEVKAQATRGAEAARELAAGVARFAAELSQLEPHLGQAQSVVSEVAQDSARTAGAASDAEAALQDVSDRVKLATGTDPEAIRAMTEAADRARAMAASLGSLAGRVPRSQILSALRPALEPLARLLAEEDPEAPAEHD
jgi:methyl-accepting chemotaxis protein